jgi:hypothetical protein
LTNHKYLIDKISHCQISQVVLEPTQLWLRLEFIDPIDLKEIVLELDKMAYFSLSKTSDDEDGAYVILEAKLSSVNDSLGLLSKLNYGFISSPQINLLESIYHLHIEGDICLDVVCESYKIFERPDGNIKRGYRPRIGPDGKPASSHDTGETLID